MTDQNNAPQATRKETPLVRIDPLYVDLETAAAMTTLSESTIHGLVTQALFPAPREISGRRVGYLYSEVVAWANSRPRSSMLPPSNTGAKKPRRKAEQESAGQPSA